MTTSFFRCKRWRKELNDPGAEGLNAHGPSCTGKRMAPLEPRPATGVVVHQWPSGPGARFRNHQPLRQVMFVLAHLISFEA